MVEGHQRLKHLFLRCPLGRRDRTVVEEEADSGEVAMQVVEVDMAAIDGEEEVMEEEEEVVDMEVGDLEVAVAGAEEGVVVVDEVSGVDEGDITSANRIFFLTRWVQCLIWMNKCVGMFLNSLTDNVMKMKIMCKS